MSCVLTTHLRRQQFKPLVENLQKVEAKEIGDDEEKIFTKRSKVYRFFKDSNEWKERCVGDLNLIKNNATGRVRVEMRMEKTQRVQVNHSRMFSRRCCPFVFGIEQLLTLISLD